MKDHEPQKTDYDICHVIVFLESNDLIFSKEQIDNFEAFLADGKAVICLQGERETSKNMSVVDHDIDEIKMKTLLARFGIRPENNSVMQMSYNLNPHPKIVSIVDGFFHSTFNDYVGNNSRNKCILIPQHYHNQVKNLAINRLDKEKSASDRDSLYCGTPKNSWSIVFPYGCTLQVTAPAIPVLSTDSVSSYPMKQPIAAVWGKQLANEARLQDAKDTGSSKGCRYGRVIVVGSSDMFSDTWLEKEDNKATWDVLLLYGLYHDVKDSGLKPMFQSTDPFHYTSPPPMDHQADEKRSSYSISTSITPDMESLSMRSKSCIEWDWSKQQHLNAPQDTDTDRILTWKEWMQEDILSFEKTHIVAKIRDLYQKLDVPFEPLSLIRPKWECPMPPLQIAVYKPTFGNPILNIALEKFDLDEELSDPFESLNQCTYKYTKHILNPSSVKSNPNQDDRSLCANGCSLTSSSIRNEDLESYVKEVGHNIIHLSDPVCEKGGKEILYSIFIQVCFLGRNSLFL